MRRNMKDAPLLIMHKKVGMYKNVVLRVLTIFTKFRALKDLTLHFKIFDQHNIYY